jgi:hypothetical protein
VATTADARTDHRHPGVATLETDGDRLDLLPPVRTFFETCAQSEQRPVLVTAAGTTLSPFVVGWLRDLAGYWTILQDDQRLREVQTGRVVTNVLDLLDPDGWTEVVEPAERDDATCTIAVDVVLEHRADASTRIGDAAATVQTAFAASRPLVWGRAEPLEDRWDVETITRTAQAAMPATGPLYWRGEDACGEIAVVRSERGVVERLRSSIAHAGTSSDVMPRATRALESLAVTRSPILVCVISAIGAEPDQRTRAGPDSPERPVAALLGPTMLGRLEWDPTEVVREHGGSLVGRQRLPAALVPFEGDLEQARRRYLDLLPSRDPDERTGP